MNYPEEIKDMITSRALSALIEIADNAMEPKSQTTAKYAMAVIEDILNTYEEERTN